ncbi:1018_t:CDS:2, partial [Racocetra fulgida]
DYFVTLSSTSKGDDLEFIVFRILKKIKIDCQRKVDVSEIRKFEAVLSRYPKRTTLGIFVTLAVDGYTKVAIERAETSKFNLLLTNVSNLQQDILDYVSGNFSADSKDPEERIIDEIIGKIEQEIHAINEK